MKLLILSQYYPPEHGAPQNRLHDLAVRLNRLGVEITVLTAMPNYPLGAVFPAYRGKLLCEENIDGVRVVRSWIFPAKTKRSIPQLLSYFSFVFSSIPAAFLRIGKTDYLLCESPPIFLGFSAVIISFMKRAKLIMNISDLWPESALQLGLIKRGLIFDILESFELFLYRRSTLVSCQTEGIADSIAKRAKSAKTLFFPNGVDLDLFKTQKKSAEFRKKHGIPQNSILVGYAGNHGRSQALSQIIDAARLLDPLKFHFAFFGDGAEKNDLRSMAENFGMSNILFLDSFPRNDMPFLLSQFDLAVVPLKNIPLFDGARPSKMFELMACGVPFVFCGRGEGANIAEKSGALVSAPENPAELAKSITAITSRSEAEKNDCALKARRFVEDFFDRQKIAEKFFSELNSTKSKQ